MPVVVVVPDGRRSTSRSRSNTPSSAHRPVNSPPGDRELRRSPPLNGSTLTLTLNLNLNFLTQVVSDLAAMRVLSAAAGMLFRGTTSSATPPPAAGPAAVAAANGKAAASGKATSGKAAASAAGGGGGEEAGVAPPRRAGVAAAVAAAMAGEGFEEQFGWVVPEFEETVLRELDFTQEARNTRRVASMLAASAPSPTAAETGGRRGSAWAGLLFAWLPAPSWSLWSLWRGTADPLAAVPLRVPAVYGALSSRRVLTMEVLASIGRTSLAHHAIRKSILLLPRVRAMGIIPTEWIDDAVRADDAAALVARGVAPRDVADAIARLLGRLVFFEGFVHCDPHAGNVLVRLPPASPSAPSASPPQRAVASWELVLIDHGMYRTLDPAFRAHHAALWAGLLARCGLVERMGHGRIGGCPDRGE